MEKDSTVVDLFSNMERKAGLICAKAAGWNSHELSFCGMIYCFPVLVSFCRTVLAALELVMHRASLMANIFAVCRK
jgi:hypothetical protein